MIFEQSYLSCLSQASYLIGSQGSAVVVDPRRDVDEYLAFAERHALRIEHVVATHVHADFVAGLRELADRTGARVWLGARFDGPLACDRLADGEQIRIGSVTVTALETPGHTPESLCFLIEDGEDRTAPAKLLSGDTVFVGEVGRPDLVGSHGISAESMAGALFDSLRDKILPLDDAVELWPGHGAGSACGKSIGKETWSTIGVQRRLNWAFAETDREQFVRTLTTNLPPPPRYFAHAAALNRSGPRLERERPRLRELRDDECAVAMENGALLLDPRSSAEFGARHASGALNISAAGRFAEWCGKLIDPGRRIVLVVDDVAQAEEARVRLARVGIEDLIGWCRPDVAPASTALPQIDVVELHGLLAGGSLQVVDVRSPTEFAAGHVPGAILATLDALPHADSIPAGLDLERPTAIVCATGNRSSTAMHFLRQRGFQDLANVVGGTEAWRTAGFAVES